MRRFSLLLHMSQYMCEGQFDLHTKSPFDNPVADEKNVSKPMWDKFSVLLGGMDSL